MIHGPEILIRPAERPDLPQVLSLYAQPELDNGKTLPLAEAERIFERFFLYPDYTLYVAERNGAVVGTFALLVMDNLAHLGARSAIVESVAVAPDRQGTGIGAAMMRFALAAAREKGSYKLMLSSDAKRERAHAFYESLGFVRHGYSFRTDLGEGRT